MCTQKLKMHIFSNSRWQTEHMCWPPIFFFFFKNLTDFKVWEYRIEYPQYICISQI